MDTLQNMRVFVRVVEAGSFTAAAQSLNTTTGAMSRAVSELEAHLRTRLLNRSTRRLALTTAGETYLKRCQQILADIDNAEEEASGAHERPSGVLRMHSFASIGQHYVLPAISRYRALYPEVAVELTLSQQLPDLFEGSADVAVVGASTLPNSISCRFCLARRSAFCARRPRIFTHTMRQKRPPTCCITTVCCSRRPLFQPANGHSMALTAAKC